MASGELILPRKIASQLDKQAHIPAEIALLYANAFKRPRGIAVKKSYLWITVISSMPNNTLITTWWLVNNSNLQRTRY
jgi:hypothetical protein